MQLRLTAYAIMSYKLCQVILQLFDKVLKITATNIKLLGLRLKTINDIAFGLQLFF